MNQRHIAFDTETTGLDPRAGHRIVEIGCVEMEGYVRTGRVYHAYLNPQRDMPEEAERVHGLSAAFLADKPLFKDKAQEFLEFVGDAPLVAHNAGFDMKFINHELKVAGFSAFASNRAIDTLQIARRKYPGQPASLDALCRRFEIDLSVRTKHGALLDAELLADVYLELMGGRQVSFGLQTQAADSADVEQDASSGNKAVDFPRRHFSPNEEERERHKAFLTEYVNEALWSKLKQA